MIVIFHWIFCYICFIKKIVMNEFNDKGLKEGPWEEYHDNGNLWYKENYVNGERHGLCECYHSNGNISWRVNYVHGDATGVYQCYDSIGNSLYRGKLYQW
jgi:antitoxin component YwqK of YwqJK toxin-antitoxin module